MYLIYFRHVIFRRNPLLAINLKQEEKSTEENTRYDGLSSVVIAAF